MFRDYHHHTHHHHCGSVDHGPAILAGLAELRNEMSKVTGALGDLSATDDVLADKLNSLLAQFAAEPAAISDAVAKALSDAGLSDDEAAAGIEAARARSQSFVDRITAALTPAPGPDTTGGSDTVTDTVTGGDGADTIQGGTGDDTVSSAPSGNDTIQGGVANDLIDTTTGGQGDDSLNAGDGSDTIEGGQA